MQRIVNLCFLFSIFFYSCKSQPPIPPPERPGCNEGWQSPDLTYVPSINQCSGYTSGLGIACSPSNPFTCTGRNPFCATAGDRVFKCCSDRIQDSMEVSHLNSTEIKPICPSGAIPYKMPHVLLCDPTIVNLCPYEYKVCLCYLVQCGGCI
uniref:WAP domain-containing protein n=1 Tax=Caenorhabditis japonica TaxID=281687 RepID=A0A8R1HPP7_CAEJA